MARGISVIISGSAAPLRKAIAEANRALGGMSKGATLAFGAAATATTMFAKSAIEAAAADAQQQQILARQLRVSAGATDAQTAAVERYIDATQRSVAVSDTELRTAYSSLALSTKDLAMSQELLNLSLDVAAATGKSATSVADALAKGYAGNTRALGQLSPELKKAIKDGASFSQVLDVLRTNFAGAAAEASGTMAGQLAILANTVDEAKESIGAALLPAVQTLVPYFVDMANWAGQNAGLLTAVGTAMGVAAGGILVAKAALEAWRLISIVTTGINTALATSFTAVQISTGVGIATALAGVAAYLKIKDAFKQNTDAAYDYNAALGAVITSQAELNDYMGPVPSRDLATFQKHYSDFRASLTKTPTAASGAQTAMDKLRDSIKRGKDAIRSYVAEIRDAITANVSLSDAYSASVAQQEEADSRSTTALEERRKAYEALQQAKATGDAKAYGAALEDVAKAERNVTAAQTAKPKSYTELFREQLTAATQFAGNIKALIAAGLGKAGLAQILNLGPVAGNAVAKDLLAGTSGLTVSELNTSLASVASAATAAGMSIPGYEAALGATVGGTTAAPTIVIQAGVGDPVAIGKEVSKVLNTYGAKVGGVPIVTKKPGKATAKKKPSKGNKGS